MLDIALIAGITQGSINLVRGSSLIKQTLGFFRTPANKSLVPRVLRGMLPLNRGAFHAEDSKTCVIENAIIFPLPLESESCENT